MGSPSSAGDAAVTGMRQGPFPPPVSEMPISLRIGLARRRGVSATTRARAGFAKRLITKAGLVPTKPHGSPREPPFTWCLELGISYNYCLAVLPAPGPFSPDLGGTPSWNPHITPRPCWVLPVPNFHGDTTHGYLMSMGYGGRGVAGSCGRDGFGNGGGHRYLASPGCCLISEVQEHTHPPRWSLCH